MNDLIGSCVVVDASVNIMDMAGKLKDIPYRKKDSSNRALSTGDAIMFATALYLIDGYGVSIDAFHTFDDGGKKREVPLLSYQEWCEGIVGPRLPLVRKVINLPRLKPIHPEPRLVK